MAEENDLTVIDCFRCSDLHGYYQDGYNCPKCSGTGRLFWVSGYGFPYTPAGEKIARERQAVSQ